MNIKLLLTALVIFFGSGVSRADSMYTVTENFPAVPSFDTMFSFIVSGSSIPSSGDATAITQISGSTVSEFSWSSDTFCNVVGLPGDANACISFSSRSGLVDSFTLNSFLTDGTYTSLGGDMTVTISPVAATATPEPSSLLLLGTGLVGILGAARRKLTA